MCYHSCSCVRRLRSAQDSDNDDDFEVVPRGDEEDMEMWDVRDENTASVARARIERMSASCSLSCIVRLIRTTELTLTTPEAVTLAQQLVNRQTTRTQLINDGFNRYSLNSKEGLPSWFLDDESRHYKANIPITKEAVTALRAKQRALDARPIKKVAEAKARKKFKTAQRLEKAMKKAEGVNATADLSEREKAQQIEKVMRKGMSSGQKARKEVKVVVAKGAHKGLKGRPKGVKGRYVMLDPRMRKEVSSCLCFLSRYSLWLPRCALRSGKKRRIRRGNIDYHHIIYSTTISILPRHPAADAHWRGD